MYQNNPKKTKKYYLCGGEMVPIHRDRRRGDAAILSFKAK
jgi:hypothetical protein